MRKKIVVAVAYLIYGFPYCGYYRNFLFLHLFWLDYSQRANQKIRYENNEITADHQTLTSTHRMHKNQIN
jgi:hypothetical protein